MTNEEIKSQLENLKENLYSNHAVYHERVTILIQLTQFDILETRVNFKAKIIKPLNRKHAETNGLYRHMISKDEIEFDASYFFGGVDNPILNGTKLGRPYCPFTLWLDPDLVKFVIENEDDVTRNIPKYILWDEDWTVIRKEG